MFKIIKLKGGVSIMKVIQRNKIKFKVFTEEELKEKLGMREEDIKVVLEYQDKFPELLQNKEGFCIDGEKLNRNSQNKYEIKLENHIKVLIPKKDINKLFEKNT